MGGCQLTNATRNIKEMICTLIIFSFYLQSTFGYESGKTVRNLMRTKYCLLVIFEDSHVNSYCHIYRKYILVSINFNSWPNHTKWLIFTQCQMLFLVWYLSFHETSFQYHPTGYSFHCISFLKTMLFVHRLLVIT